MPQSPTGAVNNFRQNVAEHLANRSGQKDAALALKAREVKMAEKKQDSELEHAKVKQSKDMELEERKVALEERKVAVQD